jgi:peptidoglycan-associated lipoprotein
MEVTMNRTTCRSLAPIVLVGMSALAGCTRDHIMQPVAAPPPQVSAPQTTSSVIPTIPAAPELNVSETILKDCEIKFNGIAGAPKFAFDDSELGPGERALLRDVAACVTTGPLTGRSLLLVGRADPRGEFEYNLVLGASRAGRVSSYLMGLGLDGARITTTSRGWFDATGTDEAGWQVDRRVDLDLE